MQDKEVAIDKGFRVVDKRRFDASGNEKDEITTPPQPQTSHTAKLESPDEPAEDTAKVTPPSDAETSPSSGIDFSSFVIFLAQQAAIQLGLDDSQELHTVGPDTVGAKQTIDILGMLKTKTKGNLSTEEESILTRVLHELRMAYVQVAGL